MKPEHVILAPDCGMKYLPRERAIGKLRAMVEAAKILRREVQLRRAAQVRHGSGHAASTAPVPLRCARRPAGAQGLLAQVADRIAFARSPLVDDDGETMVGSLLVIDSRIVPPPRPGCATSR